MCASVRRQISGLRYFALLLAVSSVKTNKETPRPKVNFEESIFHGHLYVTWVVDKNFARSSIPINYNINFCPKKLNRGTYRCSVSKVVCGAIYNGRTYSGSIQQHPGNITNYLSSSDYEEIHNTIETPGPLIEGSWDPKTHRFSCGIFLHRCMDGQLSPWFVYSMDFNGTSNEFLRGPINLSVGTPVKTENITVEIFEEGCCTLSVIIKWHIIRVCRVDVPSFKVWITDNNKTVASTNIHNDGKKAHDFQTKFIGLAPTKDYVVHIESYKVMHDYEDLNATYVNKTFHTPYIKSNVILDKVAVDGYLTFSWKMNNTFLENHQDVVYNINWCPESLNPSPFGCNISTTLCKSTYNGSSTQGAIQNYEKSFTKYVDILEVLNRTLSNNQTTLIKSSWDNKQFRCKVWMNPCEPDNKQLILQYHSYFDKISQKDYEKPEFSYGFINQPEISTHTVFTDKNTISLTVSWTYRRVCAQNAATTSTISISIAKGENKGDKPYEKKKGQGLTTEQKTAVHYEDTFVNLQPFTLYKIHIKTNKNNDIVKQFWTPEGVPTASPILEPFGSSKDDCVKNKRNLSLHWQPPPENMRHGVIRNNRILYWKKMESDKKKIVDLDNRTSYILIGLDCSAEYNIQVQACLLQNASCSSYSEARNFKAVQLASKSQKEKDFSNVYLGVIIGVAVIVLIFAAWFCQRCYYKQIRVPLEPLGHAHINGYVQADDVELTTPGTYCILMNNDEDFLA